MKVIASGTMVRQDWRGQYNCKYCAATLEVRIDDIWTRTWFWDKSGNHLCLRKAAFCFTCPECCRINPLDDIPRWVQYYCAERHRVSRK